MCYINGVRVSLNTYMRYKQQQRELKHFNQQFLHQPARRGFDYSEWPVIKPAYSGNEWDPAGMFWGFIPDYVKTYEDLKNMREGYVGVMGNYLAGKPMLNVRGEDMLDNEVFADAAMNRRCLVISTEFYETRHLPKIGKRGQLLKATDPYPYRITIPDADYFLMAAIYNPWIAPDSGEVIDTFAIVTTEANSLVSQIHNVKKRMPVVFTPGDKKAWQWTNPNLSAGKIKELAAYQFPGESMEAHPVAKDFLSAEDPTTECYYPGLPKLVRV